MTQQKMVLREAALFGPLKAWFEKRGYDVFAEVPCYSSAIDLVAIKDGIVVAVELKTSLTKHVIRQAQRNGVCVDQTYAAVGTNPRNIERCVGAKVGLLTVINGVVSLALQACMRTLLSPHKKQEIIAYCKRGVFNGVGGMPCLEGVGIAQDCKRRVDLYRRDHPKTTWREIFANVPNHYASHNSMRQSLTIGLAMRADQKKQRKKRARERARQSKLISDGIQRIQAEERGGSIVAKKKAKSKKKAKKRKVLIRSGVRKSPAKKKRKATKAQSDPAPKVEPAVAPKVAPKAKPKDAPKIQDLVIRDRIKEFRRVKASDILPDPDNWRTHPRAQKDAVAGILQEIGYADALLVRETPDGLMLIDGHLRRELTPTQEIPVLILDVNEEEAHKMLVTLDPLGAMAGCDKESLKGLMDSITTDSEGLQNMLDKLAEQTGIAPPPEPADEGPDPDFEHIDELIRKWGAASGQIWNIATEDPERMHRVKCGDSTKPEDIKALLAGARPFMMVTDPPYGVDYEGGVANKKKRAKLAGDDTGSLYKAAFDLCPCAVAYTWFGARVALPVYQAAADAGYEVRALLIWNKLKPHYGAPWAHYKNRHEPCLYTVKAGHSAKWAGDMKVPTVWDIDQPARNEDHPTQKPVECMARPIRNHGTVGDIVFDPFLGSGTTILAAEQCGRSCYGMELDPGYLAVILERCEGFGLTPSLDDTTEEAG